MFVGFRPEWVLCGLIYRLQGFVARGVVGWDYGLLFFEIVCGFMCCVSGAVYVAYEF